MQAVIFDLDDTLYDYKSLDKKARANVEVYACDMLGIPKEQFNEAYQFGRQKTKAGLADVGAGHNRMLYYQKTLEYLGINPIPLSMQLYERYWGTFLREMQPFPGVKELFAFLKEKGICIMICTDLTAHIQHRKIAALGIAGDVRYLVSSEEAGKEKPAPEIFSLCLEKLNLLPDEVWYVGDSLEKDVKGAIQAGMRAVWFRPESKEDNPADASYMEVEDLKRLKELIQKYIQFIM